MKKHHNARRVVIRSIVSLGVLLLGGMAGYGVSENVLSRIVKDNTVTVLKPNPVHTCTVAAQELTTDEKIGQLVMVGINDGQMSDDQLALIKTHHMGGVLYLGKNDSGTESAAQLSDRAQGAATQIPLLIAVDQEGGMVQRLIGRGFEAIPSAAEQALLQPADLLAKWQAWGGQLRAGGVNYNLAPVADLVAVDFVAKNAPIGQLGRNYGTDEGTVTGSVRAAIKGIQQAKVVTAVKHFPGLGAVVKNTDFGSAEDKVTTADSPSVRIFQSAIEGGADSVMVSLATYNNLDKDNPAVFSKAIITDLLRTQLKWDGVVISDDLGAAAAVSAIPAAERGVKFLVAGGDLMIAADMESAQSIIGGIKERVANDSNFMNELTAHVARVLQLKNRAELVACR